MILYIHSILNINIYIYTHLDSQIHGRGGNSIMTTVFRQPSHLPPKVIPPNLKRGRRSWVFRW